MSNRSITIIGISGFIGMALIALGLTLKAINTSKSAQYSKMSQQEWAQADSANQAAEQELFRITSKIKSDIAWGTPDVIYTSKLGYKIYEKTEFTVHIVWVEDSAGRIIAIASAK